MSTRPTDIRARRLRADGVALLIPTGAVALFGVAAFAGTGWQLVGFVVALAVTVGVLAGLALVCLVVSASLEAATVRRAAEWRGSEVVLPLVPTPVATLRPAPTPVPEPVDVDPGPAPVQSGPLPLRPELLTRPARRVAAPRQPNPDRIPV